MNGIDILINKIRNNRPIDSSKSKFTEKQVKHFVNCRDSNCDQCKKYIGEL